MTAACSPSASRRSATKDGSVPPVKHEPRRQHERCPIRCAQRPSWTRARDRSVCNNLLSRSAVATVLQSPVPRQRRFAGYERLGGVARRGSEQLRRGTTTHTVLATPARSATRLKAIDIVRRIGPGLLDATWSLGQLLPPQIGCWRPLPEHPRISPHLCMPQLRQNSSLLNASAPVGGD